MQHFGVSANSDLWHKLTHTHMRKHTQGSTPIHSCNRNTCVCVACTYKHRTRIQKGGTEQADYLTDCKWHRRKTFVARFVAQRMRWPQACHKGEIKQQKQIKYRKKLQRKLQVKLTLCGRVDYGHANNGVANSFGEL